MSISIEELVTGRKVFFITPDTSLFPQYYLEDFFALGYECYFIEYDKRISLKTKVEILLSLFKDIIIFFNIDYNANEINWYSVIREISVKYGDRARIGVLYTKRQRREEKLMLEKMYNFDIGIQCGCSQLEYQKKQNFEIIERILAANQAQGRRKNIRAICSKSCTFSVEYNKELYNGTLQDISISHFSFVMPKDQFNVLDYEKLSDFRFNLKGCVFSSDAILIMSRPVADGILYVFAFASDTSAGLEPRIKQILIPNIYQLINNNFESLIHQVYERVEVVKPELPAENETSQEM